MKRGRGGKRAVKAQQENVAPKSQTPNGNAGYNTEKKSWEYQYNYEGMDQKMIEQRQRRIALKRMFEEMTLGAQAQPPQNMPQ